MFLLRGCRHPSLGQQKGAGGSRPTEGLWGEALPALSPQAAATLSTWHTLLKSAESILGTSSLPSWLPGTVCSPRPPDPDPQPHTPHLCPPSPVPGSPRQLAGEGAPAGLVWQTRLPCHGHLCRPDFGDWGWLEWGRVEGSGQGPAVIYSPLPTALSPTPLPPSPPPPTRPPRRETEESEWGWPGHCSRRPSPVGGRNTEESVGDGRGLGS